MNTDKFAVFLLLLTIMFSACKSDDTINNSGSLPVDTSGFVYPFDIGNYWNYENTSTVSDIRPDSIAHFFTEYPLYGSGTMRIVKDTLMNGVTTRQFVDSYTQDSVSYTSKIYYIQSDTALMQYAYSIYASTGIFPRLKNIIHLKFYECEAKTPGELLLQCRNSVSDITMDTLIYENPAPEALRYPIITNYQWVYRNFEQSILTKKYLGFENLGIGHLTISCIKTEFKWSTIDDMEAYQYYSTYGKLRDYLYLNDVVVTNEFGHILGTIDIREITNVTSFHVTEIMP